MHQPDATKPAQPFSLADRPSTLAETYLMMIRNGTSAGNRTVAEVFRKHQGIKKQVETTQRFEDGKKRIKQAQKQVLAAKPTPTPKHIDIITNALQVMHNSRRELRELANLSRSILLNEPTQGLKTSSSEAVAVSTTDPSIQTTSHAQPMNTIDETSPEDLGAESQTSTIAAATRTKKPQQAPGTTQHTSLSRQDTMRLDRLRQQQRPSTTASNEIYQKIKEQTNNLPLMQEADENKRQWLIFLAKSGKAGPIRHFIREQWAIHIRKILIDNNTFFSVDDLSITSLLQEPFQNNSNEKELADKLENTLQCAGKLYGQYLTAYSHLYILSLDLKQLLNSATITTSHKHKQDNITGLSKIIERITHLLEEYASVIYDLSVPYLSYTAQQELQILPQQTSESPLDKETIANTKVQVGRRLLSSLCMIINAGMKPALDTSHTFKHQRILITLFEQFGFTQPIIRTLGYDDDNFCLKQQLRYMAEDANFLAEMQITKEQWLTQTATDPSALIEPIAFKNTKPDSETKQQATIAATRALLIDEAKKRITLQIISADEPQLKQWIKNPFTLAAIRTIKKMIRPETTSSANHYHSEFNASSTIIQVLSEQFSQLESDAKQQKLTPNMVFSTSAFLPSHYAHLFRLTLCHLITKFPFLKEDVSLFSLPEDTTYITQHTSKSSLYGSNQIPNTSASHSDCAEAEVQTTSMIHQ